MKTSLKAKEKSGTLFDFSPIGSIKDSGIVCFTDDQTGFFLSLDGVDGMLFESGDFDRLHERWRSFLHLQPNEEMQLVFRKTSDFEREFVQKCSAIDGVKGEITKRLFKSQLDSLLEGIEGEDVLECSLTLVFRMPLKRPNKRSPADDSYSVEAKRDELEFKLDAMGLKSARLGLEEISQLVAKAASGNSYLNLEGGEEWPKVSIGSHEVRVDEKTFRALTLKKLPESFSELGMIQALTLLPLPIELCVRFRGKDLEPVKKRMERRRQILFGLSSRKATGDPLAEAQFREADEVLRRLNEQNDALCEMSLVVGVRGKDAAYLRRAITELSNASTRMQQLEFEESALTTFDCFLETIPGFKGKIFHKHSVLSSNGIHFLPFFRPERGDEKTIVTFKTQYGSLYSFDPVSSRLANYNWLVSGQSGAGKSFFVNSLLLQSLSLNPRIFIVDIGGSYNKLTEFLGGKLVHVDTETGFAIGPFFMAKTGDEKEDRRRRAHIQLVFQEMLRDEGRLPSVEERALLQDVLEPLLDRDELPAHPISWVRDELLKNGNPKAQRLSLLLRPWCHTEFFGSFVDHPQPLNIDDDIVTFDLKGLKEFPDLSRVLELIITSAIWASLRVKDRFTWVVLDEVAFSLLKTQPGFVQELISTCRKMWAGTVIIVQGLETLTSNLAGPSILSNTNFKAILTQRGDARGYEEPLGLKSTEAQVIRGLSRRKGFYSDIFLMDDERRAVLRYAPDPLTYLLSTTDAQELRALEERMASKEGSYAERLLSVVEDDFKETIDA